MRTADFFDSQPVFSLDEAAKTLAPPGGRLGTLERLKYHLKAGRLKPVARGVYAVVPTGLPAARFQPDPFLTASAVRPDGIFSHHSALELLGAAHSVWNQCTLYVQKRRGPLRVGGTTIVFMEHPAPMRRDTRVHLGTRRVERRGKMLETTGPERTLAEGFRRPALAGGLGELVSSASGFATLDLDLLKEILHRYDISNLWAATGWFLERFQHSFHVPEDELKLIEQRCPHVPQYLERNQRGGDLVKRWNLILPKSLKGLGEPDEP